MVCERSMLQGLRQDRQPTGKSCKSSAYSLFPSRPQSSDKELVQCFSRNPGRHQGMEMTAGNSELLKGS